MVCVICSGIQTLLALLQTRTPTTLINRYELVMQILYLISHSRLEKFVELSVCGNRCSITFGFYCLLEIICSI